MLPRALHSHSLLQALRHKSWLDRTSLALGSRSQSSISSSSPSASVSATAAAVDVAASTDDQVLLATAAPHIRHRTRDGIPLRMLILGAPGAGKGTQSSRIRKTFDIAAISSGDVLRRNIAEQTPAGIRAKESVAKGDLVSDDIIVELIQNELNTIAGSWLLDGFPRNIAQAQALDNMLKAAGQPLNAVVNLVVPEDVILSRIIERYVHVPSGRVYNLTYNPPRVPGVDDVTGEPLEHRPDDNPESFKRRLQQYHALTEPLLEYYGKSSILTSFVGSTSDIIYPQLHRFLDERFD
ncbi:Adenylate kinase 2 [Coemansia erecta]|uniref:GTP:AMP phosphotransferase, mitochondrial n=1 Tax=Coemansia asiatica TaxID=1052880 RepID=A0A9W7XNG7_9FUNG|nr:Adenylate kinase 2 [Coemansia asiatica]KAJ2855240.1 Adenylate kinase 2 [Coemansia erecta]